MAIRINNRTIADPKSTLTKLVILVASSRTPTPDEQASIIHKLVLKAAVVAVVVVVALAVVLFIVIGNALDNSVIIDLSVVQPTSVSRETVETASCPVGAVAQSPIAESSRSDDLTALEGDRVFTSSQIVVWNLAIGSDGQPGEPHDARLAIELGDSFDESVGVFCMFISDGDASPTLRWNQRRSDDESTTAQLLLSGIESGQATVVQFWTLIDPAAGQQPTLRAAVSPGADTDSNSVEESVEVSFRQTVEPAGGELTVEISDTSDEVLPGDRFVATWTVENSTQQRVFDIVELVSSFDGDITMLEVTIDDHEGFPTGCEVTDLGFACDLGWVDPGEQVSIAATGLVAVDASAVLNKTAGDCSTTGSDLCSRGELSWLGAFDRIDVSDSEAADLKPANEFAVTVLTNPAAGYLSDNVEVKVLVHSTSAGATIAAVRLAGCEPELEYEAGDQDNDQVFDSGEVWQFGCSAQLPAATGEVSVQGRTGDRSLARTARPFSLDLISPSISIGRSIEGDAARFDVANTGDTALTDLELTSEGCEPTYTNGDGDSDVEGDGPNGVLDPGEVWVFWCQDDSGEGRAGATDPLGGKVLATE